MKKRLLLWLLPIIDIFTLKKILASYSEMGVDVPLRHAKLGLVERIVGYLPVGFAIGWLRSFPFSLLIIFIVFILVAPVEFLLMKKGYPPWRFFRKKKPKTVAKIFLLEGYNAVGYFLLGAAIASLLHGY
ncbi:MAG: hypothetical protein QXT22_04910 [Candidatus Hadarchaeales archaeon]